MPMFNQSTTNVQQSVFLDTVSKSSSGFNSGQHSSTETSPGSLSDSGLPADSSNRPSPQLSSQSSQLDSFSPLGVLKTETTNGDVGVKGHQGGGIGHDHAMSHIPLTNSMGLPDSHSMNNASHLEATNNLLFQGGSGPFKMTQQFCDFMNANPSIGQSTGSQYPGMMNPPPPPSFMGYNQRDSSREDRFPGSPASIWSMTDDGGHPGMFNNSMTSMNNFPNPCLMNGKRPITGGHNLMRHGGGGGGGNLHNNQWPMGQQQQQQRHHHSSADMSGHKQWSTSSNSPWNQALANQRMGMSPAPVNSLSRMTFLNSGGGKQGSSNSPNANSMYHMFPKKAQHRIPNLHHQQTRQFDYMTNQQHHQQPPPPPSVFGGSGDQVGVDSLVGPGGMPKSSPLDSFAYDLDHQLQDLMKPLDGVPDITGQDQFGLMSGMFPGMQREEKFSRKVFVGGLPPDIDEEEITNAFRRFGPLVVDWPHKAESKSYFPPKGYCFLLFQDERSVEELTQACIIDEDKYYWCVSSPTIKDKPVQIRPWNLGDSDYVMDGSQPLDPRKTIFVGGVPRPLRAIELAMIMNELYGGVCYAGIDTDPELKYPKGAGRVAFSNQQSYIAAISARFVQLHHGEIDKRVEVKPYVLDDQMCDECQGMRCGGKFAPFFCANITCLQYYCEQCWAQIHSRAGREYHKPLVKEGADRPRTVPFRM